MEVAGAMDDTPFAVTFDPDVYKEYKMTKDGVVLLKKVSIFFSFFNVKIKNISFTVRRNKLFFLFFSSTKVATITMANTK